MENIERIRQGALIAQMRKKAGLTQRQLASMTGIDQSNIARIEKGRYSASLDVLLKIEKALGIKRIYIDKNKEIMGTPYTFTIGSTDNVELYETIKDFACFSAIELSKDKSKITAVWNEDYKDDNLQFLDDEDPDLDMVLDELLCRDTEWACGDTEDYPIGAKVWWFVGYSEVITDPKEIEEFDREVRLNMRFPD